MAAARRVSISPRPTTMRRLLLPATTASHDDDEDDATRCAVFPFESPERLSKRDLVDVRTVRAMRCATRSRHCRHRVSPPRSLRLVPDQPNKSFSPVQTVPREFEFSRTSGATAQKNWSALFTPIKYFGHVSDRRARRRSVDRALHHSLRARALDFLSIPRGVRMRLEEGDASSTGSASASTSGGGDGDDDLGFWMLLSGREVSRPTHPPGRQARARGAPPRLADEPHLLA